MGRKARVRAAGIPLGGTGADRQRAYGSLFDEVIGQRQLDETAGAR